MWKLSFDNQEIVVKIEERPTMDIEEEEQPDGSWATVSCKWLPIKVLNFVDIWEGKKDVTLIYCDTTGKAWDRWILKDSVMTDNQITFSECNCEVC